MTNFNRARRSFNRDDIRADNAVHLISPFECLRSPQTSLTKQNERIVGDLAALEYLDENGKWKLMGFVKEDGDWKMSVPDAKISAIRDAPR